MAGKDDHVGYKRPPHNSRFRPGQSGNLKGRPKHVRSLKSEFLAELGEFIRVREGDREMKISKQRAFVKALVAAAIKGNMRATAALVAFCSRAFGNDPEDSQSQSPTPDDLEILAEFVGREERRRAARGGADNESQPPLRDRNTTDEK
jgi:hypothetical protein